MKLKKILSSVIAVAMMLTSMSISAYANEENVITVDSVDTLLATVAQDSGLAGTGTETDPFIIASADDLVLFRDSVNAGETKYNAEGVYVALGADIDMAGIDWSVNIGDGCNATFDGIFDGKGYTISNLTSTETAQIADGYICSGLFGAIAGNAQVKNFTIKNATINTGSYTGSNIGVVVGFAYNSTGSIENVKVIGDIKIDAQKAYAAGPIIGYAFYGNPTIENCSVEANDGSYIKASSEVGGIVGYGGPADVIDSKVSNIDLTAAGLVGGICGTSFTGSTYEGIIVSDVELTTTKAEWVNSKAVVVGAIASHTGITISDVTSSNVTSAGAEVKNWIGSTYAEQPTAVVPAIVALVNGTYYTSFEEAMNAANEGDTVTLNTDVEIGTTSYEINKKITLDLGGNTITTNGTYGGLRLKGNCSIKNGTINHKGTVTAIKAWDVKALEDLVITVDFKAGKTIGGIVIQENSAGIDTLKNVTINGAGLTNGIETYNCGNATEPVIGSMENVTIDAVGTGMLISAPCGTATNCDIKGGSTGIEIWIKGTYSASLDLVGCNVEGGDRAVYAHDEFSSNPDVVNSGTVKLTADATTTFASEGVLSEEVYNNIDESQVVIPEEIREGTGLAGSGTEADPFIIASIDDLVLFRDSVNAGETKYNAEGVYVALGADIDMAGIDWSVNIGDGCNATFDGIFDGKGYTISNLTSTETAQIADRYICSGLFGAIAGNAQVKNFTIENATIDTGSYTGSNIGVVVGFAYNSTGSIENVKVIGDIKIDAQNAYAAGPIIGYAFYGNPTIENCSVEANDGSYIKASSEVGGIVGYGGPADVIDSKVSNIDLTAAGLVGGICGTSFTGSTYEGIIVSDVELTTTKAEWVNSKAVVVGTIASHTGISISDVTSTNVTSAGADVTNWVGSTYAEQPTEVVPAIAALVNGTYYTTFAEAIAASVAGDTITLENAVAEDVTIDKAITIDGTDKAYTGKITIDANVTLKNIDLATSEIVLNSGSITAPAGLNVTTTVADYEVVYADGAYILKEKDDEPVDPEEKPIMQKLMAITNMPLNNGNYPVHFYAGIDSLDYKEVGFNIIVKKSGLVAAEIKKNTKVVYETMDITTTDGEKIRFEATRLDGAKYMFGQAMEFNPDNGWRNDNTEIVVTPYAIDLTGKVIDGKQFTISDATVKAQNSKSALFRTGE